MSLLCVDVGNSYTVFGVFEADRLVDHWRVATDDRRTADEWAVLLHGLLPGRESEQDIEAVVVCSTVPGVLHEMRDMVARHLPDAASLVVGPGVKTGLPVLVDNPREVGTDRIANALAALRLYGAPAIVVDLGTATTFDVVSPAGEYVGGAIAPGIEISLAALGGRGAQLRQVELLRPRTVVAKNTIEAMQSGVVYGFAGQVDGVVTRIKEELGLSDDQVTVVATGVLAPAVVEECHTITEHEPYLTLHGLRMIHARNSA
jgi:type III pantothenate kinase